MCRKAYQSSLIPYEDEIAELRSRRPPVAYARIAELLREKHHLSVRRETIFKFVKVRSRGRKVHAYKRDASAKRPNSLLLKLPPGNPGTGPNSKPKFELTCSERYILKRLPKEEAPAIRKKLEEQGH